MQEPAVVSLIGVSGFGAVHYADLLRQVERGAVRIAAAVVINPDQEPEKCAQLRAMGCEIFSDDRTMWARHANRIDVCFIPTGIPLHAPMTITALQSAANVLVEKPAAGTIQDVAKMQSAEQTTGKFCAVGFQSMYSPDTLWMKEQILGGAIGTLEGIKCRVQWPRHDSYYSRNGWAGRLQVGNDWILDGPINNATAHFLNLICFLAGPEQRVSTPLSRVEAELYRVRDIESSDTAALRITTTSGLPLHFFTTHATATELHPEVVVRGSEGTLTWTMPGITLRHSDGTSEYRKAPTEDLLRDHMVHAVLDRVHNPDTFICDLGIAGTQTLCVNAAHEASPVFKVPESFLHTTAPNSDRLVTIPGLEELVDSCFENETLFHEAGAPWTRPAGTKNVTNYREFTKPAQPDSAPA